MAFDRARELSFMPTASLLTPAMIGRIATHFRLPAERTEVQSDWHYQSTETPNGLGT
jgi:hypothetical protein